MADIFDKLTAPKAPATEPATGDIFDRLDVPAPSPTTAPAPASAPKPSAQPAPLAPPASIGPAPEIGLAHPINWLRAAEGDVNYGGTTTWLGKALKAMGAPGLNKGMKPGEMMLQPAGALPGALGLAGDVGDIAQDVTTPPPLDPQQMQDAARRNLRHVNAAASHAGQVLGPAAAVVPESLPLMVAGGIAQHGTQKLAQSVGLPPEVSETLGNVAAVGAGAKLHGALNAPTATPSLSRADVHTQLRQLYMPNATDAPGFVNELNDVGDIALKHAQDKGLTPSPFGIRDSLAKTVKAAAQADPYRKTFIEPYRNTVTSDGSTTIGQLDSEINETNKILKTNYLRGAQGSEQQAAALGPERVQQLQARVGALRGKLAQELSKLTGVPAEQIGAARSTYGKLNDLSDTMQHYANEAWNVENKGAMQPATLGDITPSLAHPPTALNRVKLNPRNWVNSPADRAVRRILSDYAPQVQPPLAPQPPVAAASNRPLPAWMQQDQGSQGSGGAPLASPAPAAPAASAPAIPATEPGLLRPSRATVRPTSSSPLPFGPTAATAGPGELAGRGMTVGDEHPELSLYPDALKSVLRPQQPVLPAAQGHQLPASSVAEDFLKTLGGHEDAVLPEAVRAVTQNNASGESAASQEALNRVASERAGGVKRVRIDTRSGRETPLFGPDAVDAKAGPYDRIVQRGPQGETTLDEGAKARSSSPPLAPRVPVISPKGETGTVSDANVMQAVQEGHQITPENLAKSVAAVREATKFALGRDTLGVSDLRQRFGLDVPGAIRMLDRLEEEGVVAPASGAGPRRVLRR